LITTLLIQGNQALGESHQPFKVDQRLIKVVVDNNSVKFITGGKLFPRPLKATEDRLFCISAATTNALFQHLKTGRRQKNLKGIGKTTPNLPSPLELNLQKHRRSGLQAVLHWSTRCSVAITSEFGPLQKPALGQKSLEAFTTMEKVMRSVLFSLTR